MLIASLGYSKPIARVNGNWNYGPGGPNNGHGSMQTVVIQQVGLSANNISNFYYNTGIFNQDKRTANTPGFEWPKGSGKDACFTAGLSLAAKIDGVLKEASCMYAGEYAPGYVDNSSGTPVVITNSDFKIYKVNSADNANNNPDYANWYKMIPYGAPYIDVDHNGVFDPAVDKPGVENAGTTLFACMTDGFPENHSAAEGFGGGTPPMFCEMHFTAWAYNTPGLEDIQFVNWVLINKNVKPWDNTYMGVTTDPDLGFANDDYIGCDTLTNLGYVFNGDNDDSGNQYSYGANPPSWGMDYFKSPINKSVTPYDTIGLTAFDFFTNSGSGGPICERDPNPDVAGAYYYLRGFKLDGTPWINPQTNQITKFCYPGDPETNAGWTERTGSVQNCGGSLTGTVVAVNPVGDRRLIFCSGAENFKVNVNDTQNVVVAQMVARGSSNLNSVTKLKQLDIIAQKIFDANFNVIPAPPSPVVAVSIDTVGNPTAIDYTPPSTYNLDLTWSDLSERYSFRDTLFSSTSDSSIYKFEGYEVYQVSENANQLPDFSKPETIDPSLLTLVAIFDKKDTVGVVIDTFSVGINNSGGSEQFAPFPIVPPYRFPTPPGFPNTGISRSIHLTSTKFTSENSGNTHFVYGHNYKFIVTAYAYNTHPKRGQKILRSSLSASVVNVKRDAPLAGTVYSYGYSDTISTNRHDLGVIPIVVLPDSVKNAKYKVVFNSFNYATGAPDTVYNILRSLNGGTSYDTLTKNLKPNTKRSTTSQDSARIVDGIFVKVDKIRFSGTSSATYVGNIGVIKDRMKADGTFYAPDSIQTRLPHGGWDYTGSARNLEASKYVYNPAKPYQSLSMNLSYLMGSTYTGIGTAIPPGKLKKVKIVFTADGAGQQAYRYLSTGLAAYTYQDMVPVPFQVFEVDETDSTAAPRQVNCAFLEFPTADGGNPDGKWLPGADSLGSKEVLYVFSSDYNSTPSTQYTSKNLFAQQSTIDIYYVWAPKVISSASAPFQPGDEFTIYPYPVTYGSVDGGVNNPLVYEFETRGNTISTSADMKNTVLGRINVVPNPFYGFNSLGTSANDRYVTFRRLPQQVTIKIYSLNGDLIRTLTKNSLESTLEWNLRNIENVPVSSGIYLALVDAAGYGQTVVKLAVFTPEERIGN
ncbi:hypothetical protein BH10BAC5_BH10BAC5_06450 [soil metagenome]